MLKEKEEKPLNIYEFIDEGKAQAKEKGAKSGISIKFVCFFLILLLSTAASVLVEFFTGKISLDILASWEFWLNNVGINMAALVILIIARETFKEREKNINKNYLELTDTVHNDYLTIKNAGADEEFNRFISEENRARKLKAYRYQLGKKLLKLKNSRRKIEVSSLTAKRKEKKLKRIDAKITLAMEEFENAEGNIAYIKVKYNHVSYAQIFGSEEQQKENDEDFLTHEKLHVAGIIRNRILMFLGISIVFGVIGSSFISVKQIDIGTIISACSNAVSMLLGVFWGASDGQYFVRTTINNKLRLRCSFVDRFINKNKLKSNTKNLPEGATS